MLVTWRIMGQIMGLQEENENNPVFKFAGSVILTDGSVVYHFEFNEDAPEEDGMADSISIQYTSTPTSQFQVEHTSAIGSATLQTEINNGVLIVHHIPYFWGGPAQEIISFHTLYVNVTRLLGGNYVEDEIIPHVQEMPNPALHDVMLAGAHFGHCV